MNEFMDITPDVHYLETMRAARGVWANLLGEAVDNSLDADATQIHLKLTDDHIVISDNGCGITRDREDAIVRLGAHRPMPSTKLGRFGMGIKYQATSAGDVLEVKSTSRDGHMRLTVDWSLVIRRRRWEIPRPHWSPLRAAGASGTTITISRLRWTAPKDRDLTAARDLLAQLFYPALEHGSTITLNGIAVPVLREPPLVDIIEGTIQLPNGKGAHVRAGLLAHPDPLCQVQVSYKHRVIKPKSIFGCGEYSGLRKMFARVTLTADWGLTPFKDDLSEDESSSAEALEQAIEDLIRPILERCHQTQYELKIDELTAKLNEQLPPDMRPSRPPRTKKDTTSETAKRSSGRHGRADKEENSSGPARTPRAPIDKLILNLEAPLHDEHGYGLFQPGRPNRVTLARDNPSIMAIIAQKNEEFAVQQLYDYALMIYHHAREVEPGQGDLPFDKTVSFGRRVWLTRAQQTIKTETA